MVRRDTPAARLLQQVDLGHDALQLRKRYYRSDCQYD
jgi:hypothetical protein